MNRTSAPYRMLGFDVSYFSAKVRSALRSKQLWFEEERADIGEIMRRTGHAFIPIVVTPDDETWQDSSDIFDQLEATHPDPPLFPKSPVQRVAAHLAELYIDEFGILPAMHWRWGSAEREASSRKRFSAMTGSEKVGNAAADRMVAARFAVGASDAAGPVIEAHLRDLLDALSAHVEEHPYLLGSRISFADCSMMGLLYAHLFVDLASRELLMNTAWRVVGYIERCNFPNTRSQGEWLEGDTLAPSFRELLRAMGEDAAPVILDMARAVEAWADTREDEAAPRAVGKVTTSLRGQPIERIAQTYTLWSVQRVLDAHASLAEPERKRVDQALAGTGWEPVLAYEPRHRLLRRGFDLVYE